MVGALISHTGSGVSSEMDEALGALVKLTSTPVKALRLKKFMPFIQGLLDFIKALTDAQVRAAAPLPLAGSTSTRC